MFVVLVLYKLVLTKLYTFIHELCAPLLVCELNTSKEPTSLRTSLYVVYISDKSTPTQPTLRVFYVQVKQAL